MNKYLLLITAFLCCASSALFAQANEGAPITVTASPSVLIAGKSVEFSGNTLIGKEPLPVTFKLRTPGGSVVELQTTTDKKGDYKLSYAKAFATGRYIIEAQTADEKGMSADTFTVATITGAVNDIQTDFFKSTQAVQKSLTGVIDAISKLPPSADLDAQKDKLKTYLGKLGELKGSEEKVAVALKELIKSTMDVAVSDAYLKDLAKTNAKVTDALPAIEAKAAEMKNKSEICEMINNMIEVCGFMSVVLDFKTTALKTLRNNLVSDKLIPGGLDRLITNGSDEQKETRKLAINTAQKSALAATDGAAGIANFIGTGLSLDLCSYIGKIIYAKYCDELKGDFAGTFKGTFQADNGLAWWIYDLDVKGELKLRYKKETDLSKGAQISGEFTGYRVRYGVFEDFEQVEKIPAGMTLYKKFIKSPTAVDFNKFNSDLGAGGMALVPGSFRVKVKGTVTTDNQLRLTVDPTSFGINKEEHNTLWIILLNNILPIPVIKSFEIPIATDKIIFTAMLKDQVFKMQQVKDKVTVDVKANKTHIPLGSGVAVDSKLTMSLKN